MKGNLFFPQIFCYHTGFSEILHLCLLNSRRFYKKQEIVLSGTSANRYLRSSVTHVQTDFPLDPALERVYIHLSTNDRNFELACINRWFAMRDYMRTSGAARLIHLDSDVLIQKRVNISLFGQSNTLYACGSVDDVSEWGMISPHVSVWNLSLLSHFCNWVTEMYSNNSVELIRLYEAYKQDHETGGVCDMTLIYLFVRNNNIPFENLLEFGLEGWFVDNNLNLAKNDDGSAFEMRGGLKRLSPTGSFGRGPYLCHRTAGQTVKFWALHFQGPAKKALFGFVHLWGIREFLMTKTRGFPIYKRFYKLLFPALW